MADLEGGARGFAFASGLAGMATVLDALDAGAHIVASDDLYGGTFRLFESVRKRSADLRTSFVDMTDPARLSAAIRPETRMIWVETPTNPLLKLVDLAAVAKIARAHDLIAVADNTFASPWIQRPLELGFDLVVHSATKYLNGHSDIVGGVVVVGGEARHAALGERLAFLQNAVGGVSGPFDSFLALRGLKTLALRMERHCENAGELAHWLEAQAEVARVHYPGLASHPQHALARRQMRAFGGMITVVLKTRPGRQQALSRALPTLRAGRKPGRRRKPDRAPGNHDPRLAAGAAARGAGHRRRARPPVGRHRRRGRLAPRPARRARRDLKSRPPPQSRFLRSREMPHGADRLVYRPTPVSPSHRPRLSVTG